MKDGVNLGNEDNLRGRIKAVLARVVSFLVLATPAVAQNSQSPGQPAEKQQPSLDEVAKQLENPASALWSLTFQNNVNLQSGTAVSGRPVANTFFFQPALPIPAGKSMFIIRPVFPIVSVPLLNPASPNGVSGRQAGFGDAQLLMMLGRTTKNGFVSAFGTTLKFPTASSVSLGQGKYQAGPAMALAKLGKVYTYGMSVQHWWSYAGNRTRSDTKQTDITYFLQRKVPRGWQVGLSPTVSVNWNALPDNRLTFPIGLGASKMVRLGSIPVRFRGEIQYSIVRPKGYGTQWNFRFQAIPVIKSPFGA